MCLPSQGLPLLLNDMPVVDASSLCFSRYGVNQQLFGAGVGRVGCSHHISFTQVSPCSVDFHPSFFHLRQPSFASPLIWHTHRCPTSSKAASSRPPPSLPIQNFAHSTNIPLSHARQTSSSSLPTQPQQFHPIPFHCLCLSLLSLLQGAPAIPSPSPLITYSAIPT
jgi:hypothetical protein